MAQGTVFTVKLHRFLELVFADCSNGVSDFTGVSHLPIRLWIKKMREIKTVKVF